MRKRSALSLLTALILVLGALGPAAATAASTSNGSGIKVSPVRTDLTIDPGKQATVNMTLQNLTPTKATFTVQVNDFTTDNLNGIPNLIVNSQTPGAHSIRPFIAPIKNLTVGSGQAVPVSIIIKVPAGTSGGGYYGAVRFIEQAPVSGKTVNINASVASLVLITVPGPQLNQDLALSSFKVEQSNQPGRLFFSNRNLSVNSIFTNDGNVQIAPFGKVTIETTGGKVIKTLTINNGTPAGNVLPGSSRQFPVSVNGLSMLGEYKAVAAFGYGNQGRLLTASVTFYIVPAWLVVIAAVIVVLLILGIIFAPKFFRWWYRRSVRKGR